MVSFAVLMIMQESTKRADHSPKRAVGGSPPKQNNAVARLTVAKTKQNAAAKRQLQQSLAAQTALVEQLQQQVAQLKHDRASVSAAMVRAAVVVV